MPRRSRAPRFGDVETPGRGRHRVPQRPDRPAGHALRAASPHEDDGAFLWLHSIDDPYAGAAGHEPVAFFPTYEVELSDCEAERIGITDPAQADVFVTVRADGRARELQREPARTDPHVRRPRLPGHQRGRGGARCGRRCSPSRSAETGTRIDPPAERRAGTDGIQGGTAMLIITRRAGQKIMLGDDITIHVMEIVGQHRAPGRRSTEVAAGLPRGDLDGGARRERGGRDGRDERHRAAVGSAPARGRRRRVGGARPESSQSAVSPSTIRSATSAAASTRPPTSASLWRQRPST